MRVVAIVIAVLLASAGVARAERVETKRYGKTIAGVDAAAVGLMAAGGLVLSASTDDNPIGLTAVGLGAVVYLGGGAVVHWRHGRAGAASMSVADRLLVPFAAGGVGALVGKLHGKDREAGIGTLKGAAIGMGVGMGIAMAIDWLVLAREKRVTPVVQPTAGGAIAGVAGRF